MSAGVCCSISAEPTQSASGRRRVRSPIVPAVGGDHAAIACFLGDVFGETARSEFNASIDDPFYEPRDRLLLRRAGRIIAHVHLTHRIMHFGSVRIPVAGLGGLATSPQCRGQGLGTHLLAAAEKQMIQSGALVGLLRCRIPYFFRRTGWALWGPHNSGRTGAHAVLSRLLDEGLRPGRRRRLHVRPWRRWEEAGLMRIYNQNVGGSYGLLERTRPYWRWLLQRRAFDQLYVALDGPNLWDLDETSTQLVGYAAIKGGRILELMTAPGRWKAAVELLARICGDAIEQDRHTIILHAPPGSPLLGIFDPAGGRQHDPASDCGEVHMARLLDPVGLLRHLCGEFSRRAEAAGLARPLELGLLVDGRKYQIELGTQAVRAVENHLGRSYLRLNVADFTRLVLGQLDWDRACSEGRLAPSTVLASEAGRALFPMMPLWRPPLDDLMTDRIAGE